MGREIFPKKFSYPRIPFAPHKFTDQNGASLSTDHGEGVVDGAMQ